jgi:hypothetical protein
MLARERVIAAGAAEDPGNNVDVEVRTAGRINEPPFRLSGDTLPERKVTASDVNLCMRTRKSITDFHAVTTIKSLQLAMRHDSRPIWGFWF